MDSKCEADAIDGPFKCSYCEKKFETKRELVHHKYNHQSNSKYSCQVCNKVFTSHEGLSRHSRVHQRGKKPVKCKLCKQSFSMKLDLEEHHRDCHLEQKAFRCKVCGAEFSWEENLQKHQRMHMVDNYKCQYCDRVFCDTISLKIHQRHHKPVTKPPSPDFKPFSCSVCGMRFQFDFSYKAHMNCHKVQGVPKSEDDKQGDKVLSHSAVDSSEKTLIAEFHMPQMKNRSNEVSVEICENTKNSQGVSTVRLKPEVEDDIFDHTAHMNRIPADKTSIKVHDAMPYRSANNEISSFIKNSLVSKKNDNESAPECENSNHGTVDESTVVEDNKDGDCKNTRNGKKRKAYSGRYGELSMTESKAYQCSFCKKSFRWEVSLKVHIEQHKTGSLKGETNGKVSRKAKKVPKVFQKKNSPLKSQLVKRRAGSDDEEDDYIESAESDLCPANKKKAGAAKFKPAKEGNQPTETVSTVVHLKKVSDSKDEENVTYVKNCSDIVCITPINRAGKVFEGAALEGTVSNPTQSPNGEDQDSSVQIVSISKLKKQVEEDIKSEDDEGGANEVGDVRLTRSDRYTVQDGEESDTAEDTQLYISMDQETGSQRETGQFEQPTSNNHILYNDKNHMQQTVTIDHTAGEQTIGIRTPGFTSDCIKAGESAVSNNAGSTVCQSQAFLGPDIVSVQPIIQETVNVGVPNPDSYNQNGQDSVLHTSHMQNPVSTMTGHDHTMNDGKSTGQTSFSFKPITSISSIPEPPVTSLPETQMSQLEKILMSGTSVSGTLPTLASTEPCVHQQFVYSELNAQSVHENNAISSGGSASMSGLTQQKENLTHNGLAVAGNTTCLQSGLVQGSLLNYMQRDSTQHLQGMANFIDTTSVTPHTSQQALSNQTNTAESSLLNPALQSSINSTMITEIGQTYPKPSVQASEQQQGLLGSPYLQHATTSSAQYLTHDSHTSPLSGIPNVQAIQKMVQSLPEVPGQRNLTQSVKAVRKQRIEETTRNINQTIVNHQGQLVVANPDICQITQVSAPNTIIGPNMVSSDSPNIVHNMQVGLQNNNMLTAIPIQNTQNPLQGVQQSQMVTNVTEDTSSVSSGHHATHVNVGVPSQDAPGHPSTVSTSTQMLENTSIIQPPVGIPATMNTHQQINTNAGAKAVMHPGIQGRTVVLNNIQSVQNILPTGVSGPSLQDKSQSVLNSGQHHINNVQIINKNVATSQGDNVLNSNLSNVAIIQGNVQQVQPNPVIMPSLQNNMQYVQPAIQQGIVPLQTPVQAVGLGNQSEIRILGNIPNILGTVHLQTGYVNQQVSCINEFGQVLAVTPLFQIPVDQNNLHQSVGGTFIQQTPGHLVQGQPQILAQPIIGQPVVQNLQAGSSLSNFQGSGVSVNQQCVTSNMVNVVTGTGMGPPSVQPLANQMMASTENRPHQNQVQLSQSMMTSSQELVHIASHAKSIVSGAATSSPKLSQLDGCYQRDTIDPCEGSRYDEVNDCAFEMKSFHICYLCGKLLMSSSDHKLHMALSHARKNMINCQECGEVFENSVSWVHHRCKRLSKQCGICNKVIRNIYELKVHKYNHRKARKGIQCKVCKQKFFGIKGLAMHMKSH